VKNINQILREWPYGTALPLLWLNEQGMSGRDAAKHAQRGNLLRLGSGAYARPGDLLTWEGGVYGLQYREVPPELSFWPGGETALRLAGYSHYLMLGRERLCLYGQPRIRLSKWFKDTDWGVQLEVSRATLFPSNQDRQFDTHTPAGRDFQIYISSPEMAVLEWLFSVSDELLFSDGIVDTFSGLTSLRPRRLQVLLQACTSIRTKRAFLLLARYFKHGWYSRLDISAIELGRGKRQLVKGGVLDEEYQVTVPTRFANAD